MRYKLGLELDFDIEAIIYSDYSQGGWHIFPFIKTKMVDNKKFIKY